MKYYKIFMMGAAFSLGLSSCVSEELPSENSEKGKGSMSLGVDKLKPSPTRGDSDIETEDFPVTIYSSTTNEIFTDEKGTEYKEIKASEIPNKITMPVGTYYAKAHTPGELKKIMTNPYYQGQEEFEILQGVNTKATITCRMANGNFKVNYSDDFSSSFTSWTISIDDGTESVIQFTNEQGLTPPVVYMTFEEEVEFLTVNFKGTTTSGSQISAAKQLTKPDADEQYDDDNEYFSGGDAIVINFSPTESTEGTITGITLTANIQFDESNKEYPLDVTDKNTSGGGESGDTPGGGEGESDAIILNLPQDMTVDSNTDPSLGDTYIEAPNGIKSIIVKMSSTNEGMESSLGDLASNYEGVDFHSGTEIVENQSLIQLFQDLDQTLSVPTIGDKDYTFPIGNFFILLTLMPGEHTFNLTVTDMDGNTKSGTLILTAKETSE